MADKTLRQRCKDWLAATTKDTADSIAEDIDEMVVMYSQVHFAELYKTIKDLPIEFEYKAYWPTIKRDKHPNYPKFKSEDKQKGKTSGVAKEEEIIA